MDEMNDSSKVVEFVDSPPVTGREGGVWATRLGPLVEHEGQWALIGEFSISTASNLRKGAPYPSAPGKWEFTGRAINHSGERASAPLRTWLYARYLGAE